MYRCILTEFSKKNSNVVERKAIRITWTQWLFPTLRQPDKIVHWSANKSIHKDFLIPHWAGVHTCLWKSFLTLLFHSQQDGIISVQDIDLVMSEGLGMRYAFIGPMETMHLNAPKGNAASPKTAPTHVLNIRVCDVEAMNWEVCLTERAKPQGGGEYQRGVWNPETNTHTHTLNKAVFW